MVSAPVSQAKSAEALIPKLLKVLHSCIREYAPLPAQTLIYDGVGTLHTSVSQIQNIFSTTITSGYKNILQYALHQHVHASLKASHDTVSASPKRVSGNRNSHQLPYAPLM